MPTTTTLAADPAHAALLVTEVLRHTPIWVWAILAGLTVLGSRQMRDREVSRLRLIAVPTAMLVWSAWSAASAFGWNVPIVGSWVFGLVAVGGVATRRSAPAARPVSPAARLVLAGSCWPLVGLLSIFVLRYAVAVGLAMDAQALRGMPAVLLAGAFGALSGGFAARSIRCLAGARATGVPG